MDCSKARNLFDAYLDGELSPALATELGAHRLHCADCRHDLALMEVAGHVVALDGDFELELGEDFTSRLLSCMETTRQPARLWPRFRRRWIMGGAMAAAAAAAITAALWFQRPARLVLGAKRINPTPPAELHRAADSIRIQVENTWNDRARNARQLIDFGQMTIMQIMDRLDLDASVRREPYNMLPESFDELAPAPPSPGALEDL